MFFTFCSFKMGWNPLIFLTFLLEKGGSMRLSGAVRQHRHAQSLSGSRMLLGMHQSPFKKIFESNRCFNFLTAPPDWTNSVFCLENKPHRPQYSLPDWLKEVKCEVFTKHLENFMFWIRIWSQYVSKLRKHLLKLSNLIFYDSKLKTHVPMGHKTENFFSPKSMFLTFCSFKIGWNPLIFLTFLLKNGGSMATFGSRTSTAVCAIP